MKISHLIYVVIAIYLYAHSFKVIINTNLKGKKIINKELSWNIYFNEKGKFLDINRGTKSSLKKYLTV